MRSRRAFGIGLILVVLSGVVWWMNPSDPIRLGIFAGGATGLVNLVMLRMRLNSAADMAIHGSVRWARTSFLGRMAVMLVVLLLLRHQLGTSGDLSFLGGFFVVEAAVLICS